MCWPLEICRAATLRGELFDVRLPRAGCPGRNHRAAVSDSFALRIRSEVRPNGDIWYYIEGDLDCFFKQKKHTPKASKARRRRISELHPDKLKREQTPAEREEYTALTS
jgi:hypothetical protein